ncbi:MAG: Bug family tripartite tricarboxylate transporter substrate binding protein [Xanthobacteraceae bacterium]
MVAALMLGATAARAQSQYPNRVIRLIVPFPAGGATDVFARQYATRISTVLSQQVVIDNKTGAAGTIGAAEVARAEPNGYTALFATASVFALYNLMAKKPQFDTLKDFMPIAEVGASPVIFAVHPSIPGDLKAVLAYAKANPGKLQYGSPGTGTYLHLAMEMLKQEAGGVDIGHIPYRGGAPAIADTVAGQVPMLVDAVSTSLQHHRGGRMRILAVALAKRSPLAPDIPTVDEAIGTKGFVAALWNAVAVPAGTPPEVVDRLHAATEAALADRSFTEQLLKMGIEPTLGATPQSTRDFIVKERARWKPVVEATGVSAE